MKKGLLLLIISMSISLVPLFARGYDDPGFTYKGMSEEKFGDFIGDMSNVELYRYLRSLDKRDLARFLEAADMTKDEYVEFMTWVQEEYKRRLAAQKAEQAKKKQSSKSATTQKPKTTTKKKSQNSSSSVPQRKGNKTIRQIVYDVAVAYTKVETQYVSGGQKTHEIDCSGLVINCYKKAFEGTNYNLKFKDTTAYNLYSEYTVPTKNPVRGDLVFMSYSWKKVDHVGIFDCIKDGEVYFIDATLNHYNKSGNSVNRRHYPIGDKRIVSFGRMKFIKD